MNAVRFNLKKNLLWLLKALISIFLLMYLFYRIDLNVMVDVLHTMNGYWVLAALVVLCMDRMTMVARWHLLVKGVGIKTNYWSLLRLMFVGNSLGSMTPGAVAGDLVKIYGLSQHQARPLNAGAAVVMDRFVGLASLCLITAGGSFAARHIFPEYRIILLLSFVSLILLAFLILVMTSKFVISSLSCFRGGWIIGKLAMLPEAMSIYRKRPRPLILAMAVSVVLQFERVLAVYFLARALEIDTSLSYFIIFVPIVFFARQLPISINGIGVSQGLYVWLFGLVGVSEPAAFTLSIASMLAGYLFVGLGALLFWYGGIGGRKGK